MAPLQRASPHPQAITSDQTIIQHFTHPKHPLQRVYIQAEYSCDGCNTWGGAGFRYRCSAGCDFDLHEQCATCPLSLSSHLHPNHQLVLVNQTGNGHYCNSCRQLVNGLFYTCRPCDVELHPICCTKTPHQPQLQVLHPTGPVLAMNRGVSQAPTSSPRVYYNNNNSLNSPGFGVNQGFVQAGGAAQGIGYPQNNQPYNLPSNNQPYNLPSNNQPYNLPSNNQTYNLPSNNQTYNLPSSNNQTYNLPSSNNQTYNLPSSNNQTYNLPSSNNQTYNLPSSNNQTYNLPSSNNQTYNLPSSNNNNGLVAASGSNRQTNNNNNNNRIGTFVRKAVTTSIFGFPI